MRRSDCDGTTVSLSFGNRTVTVLSLLPGTSNIVRPTASTSAGSGSHGSPTVRPFAETGEALMGARCTLAAASSLIRSSDTALLAARLALGLVPEGGASVGIRRPDTLVERLGPADRVHDSIGDVDEHR